MGVTGLWMLLAPGGRQVSMESLSGQTLAVDASIWLTQFVKAMRDPEDGTMLRNAHLLGTFHRVSKLLTHGIRPVFVFDGDTPAIKLKTLKQRRSRREKSQDTLAQTAKKLLIKQQREMTSKAKNVLVSEDPRVEEAVDSIPCIAISSEESDECQSDDNAAWSTERFEAYQRDRRQDARETFLTLAGKPEEYSMAQISTFLKASKLKREMTARQSAIDSPESGRRIASEGGRRYVYSKPSTAPLAVSNAPSHRLDASDASVGHFSDYVRVQSESRTVKAIDDDSFGAKKGDSFAYGSPVMLNTKHPSWFSGGKMTEVVDLASPSASVAPKNEDMPPQDDDGEVLDDWKSSSTDNPSAPAQIASPVLPPRTCTPTPDTDEQADVEGKEHIKSSNSDDESDIEWEDVGAPEDVNPALLKREDMNHEESTAPFCIKDETTHLPQSDNSDFEWEIDEPDQSNSNGVATSSHTQTFDTSSELFARKIEQGLAVSDDDEGDDVTTSALQAAMSTATNLTQWAAGAVKRAILAHKQLGAQFEASQQPQSPSKLQDLDTMRYLPRAAPSSGATADSPLRYLPRELPLNATSPDPLPNSLGDLSAESEADLRRLRNQKLRDVDGVTDEMKSQVMDLLRLFGVPFLVCPMEAEAQCATLEQLGLVQGIITDDSDIFAFGGKKVYKNMFKDTKFVEAYFAADLERELGLDQDRIIALALLLGSDYTDGINGIGIVNAAEVVAAFGGLGGLKEFNKWVNEYDVHDAVKKQKKLTPAELSDLTPLDRFKHTHHTIRRNWNVSEIFPNPHVIKAYQYPNTDKSTTRFSWSVPDLANLRVFCGQVFGWPLEKVNSKLIPVVHAVSRGFQDQTRIDSYFTSYNDNVKYAKIRSKRLKSVVDESKEVKKFRKS